MLYKRQDPNKSQTKFQIIFVIGIVVNVIAGVVTALTGNPANTVRYKALSISKSIFTLPLVVSCCFLGDAFRRLTKIRMPNQMINKRQVAALSAAFGTFALGMVLLQVEFLIYGSSPTFIKEFLWTYEVMIICFFVSTLILSLILYRLIIVQQNSLSHRSRNSLRNSEKI